MEVGDERLGEIFSLVDQVTRKKELVVTPPFHGLVLWAFQVWSLRIAQFCSVWFLTQASFLNAFPANSVSKNADFFSFLLEFWVFLFGFKFFLSF